jgi:hypothetical protein
MISPIFAAEVRGLGPPYSAEVSYIDGFDFPYGTRDSVRADAAIGPDKAPLVCDSTKIRGALASKSETES